MKRKNLIFTLAAIVGLVVMMLIGGSTVAAEVVFPFENATCRVFSFLRACARGFLDAQATGLRNRALARENEALRLVRTDNENLRRENERLRVLAGFEPTGGRGRWIPALVLSRNGVTGARHFLRVNRGTCDGVRTGAAVVTPEGVVGHVTETGPHEARVIPLADSSVRIAARVETGDPSADAVYGILYGGGLRADAAERRAAVVFAVNPLRLGHLGADAAQTIPPRARVVTSGLGGVYPRGLPLGRLAGTVTEDKFRLERQADVIPAVDFINLEHVFIRRED